VHGGRGVARPRTRELHDDPVDVLAGGAFVSRPRRRPPRGLRRPADFMAPAELLQVGGPRDADVHLVPRWVLTMPEPVTGILHLRPVWVDGEDEHLPPSQRMRALYRQPALGVLELHYVRQGPLLALAGLAAGAS